MSIPNHHKINAAVNENNWRIDRGDASRFEKDGYEIYLYNDGIGFELTIRDPDTRTRKSVVQNEQIDLQTPLAVAFLTHLLENAELVVSNASN